MDFGITAIGSGSSGNSFLVHTLTEGILVDAGFSRREILSRLELSGHDAGIIKALLLTHEHGDHVCGARVLADQLGIPTFVTRITAEYLRRTNKLGQKVHYFEPGNRFGVGAFTVEPFSVPHDALDPVGFIISQGDCRIGLATDLGQLTMLVRQRLQNCQILVLECNHDVAMQRQSARHLHLKRRVLSKHGHMNNDDAMAAVAELLGPATRCLMLAHLSSECNSAELVEKIANQRLAELGRQDILLHIVTQEKAVEPVWLS